MDRRLQRSGSYGIFKPEREITPMDLAQSCDLALSSIRAGAKLDATTVRRLIADRKELTDLIPWDTDTDMLSMMNNLTDGPTIRQQLALYLSTLNRTRQFAQTGLTACFTQRYLGSHIWSEGRVR
jgi:hypothetical protein